MFNRKTRARRTIPASATHLHLRSLIARLEAKPLPQFRIRPKTPETNGIVSHPTCNLSSGILHTSVSKRAQCCDFYLHPELGILQSKVARINVTLQGWECRKVGGKLDMSTDHFGILRSWSMSHFVSSPYMTPHAWRTHFATQEQSYPCHLAQLPGRQVSLLTFPEWHRHISRSLKHINFWGSKFTNQPIMWWILSHPLWQ